jgi:hypothetical protein
VGVGKGSHDGLGDDTAREMRAWLRRSRNIAAELVAFLDEQAMVERTNRVNNLREVVCEYK